MTLAPGASLSPSALSPFVGRQDDLQKLQALVQAPATRLVTLLGSGGIGKTRLALELLGRLQENFAQGTAFIPLAQLSSAEEILPALAERLGVQSPPSGDLKWALLEHLAGRQALLLLDNFEHLLGGALLVRDLLAVAPAVKVIVTSREKLGLECESLYRLSGLELAPTGDLESLAGVESVQLFLQKAGQVRHDFHLDARNAEAVRQICEHLGGNPLGILLAAAWVEHFSPAEILDQLTRNLDFLSRQARDADPRHSSMRAVFEASFNRLDDLQKVVFRKLAHFRGGFDLAAAGQIAGADLPALVTLVDKCMLWRDPLSGRYEMHELLRQYAGEKLEAAGESQAVQAAHGRHYLEFVSSREASLSSALQNKPLDEIQADFDNIRQAFAWAVAGRQYDLVRSVLPGLYAFADHRSRFYEGSAIFHLAVGGLAPLPNEPPHPAWALALLSWYDMRTYHEPFASFEELTSMAKACLKQATALADKQGITASLTLLGAIEEDQLDFKPAIRRYERAMRTYPQLDDIYWINMRIGLSRQAARQYPQAIQAFQASLELGRKLGDQQTTGWALANIGDALRMQNKTAEAIPYLEQARQYFTQVNAVFGVMWILHSLGRAEAALGEIESALTHGQEALRLARQVHSGVWIGKNEALLEELHSAPSPLQRQPDMDGETFSPRELEVLRWLKSDLSGPEIADRLVVSLNTVRFHTKNIYQKLGVNSRLEAIQRAKELGL